MNIEITPKQTIEELLRSTKRQGIEDLLHLMEVNGFYSAPCSSKYHLAKPGGLAEHSLNVYRVAKNIAFNLYTYPNTLSKEMIDSIVICSLLHDLGKAGQFGKPNYRPVLKPQTEISAEFIVDGFKGLDPELYEYETNKDLQYIPHEVRSIAIASQYINLTEEEQFAILYHNGLYGELKGFKGKETPLQMILHFADLWAARVIEN